MPRLPSRSEGTKFHFILQIKEQTDYQIKAKIKYGNNAYRAVDFPVMIANLAYATYQNCHHFFGNVLLYLFHESIMSLCTVRNG